MKKIIIALMAVTMLATSIGYAAPLADLAEGQTNIGYNHYNLSNSVKDDSFYLENALSNKIVVGVERNGYSAPSGDGHTTDLYAHYNLDKNVRLIAGDRSYSSGSDKFFYGIGANVNLAPRIDGYASVTTSNIATEWQTGVTYKMDHQTDLHLGYKSNKLDNTPTSDGIGFGVNHKF